MAVLKPKNDYTADWPEIAKLIKDDARWNCIRCGHEHDHPSGHVLTVHHFDGDKSNNERWNLMALCQRCHLSVQGRVNPDVPLLTDPSLWAMPYIAGFYGSGRGIPGPLYNLVSWVELYKQNVGPWPTWAPREDSIHA